MRAPDFWYRDESLPAELLAPLGVAYDLAGRLRRAVARPQRLDLPVLCVGNLVAGGAGKTPVALDLARRLQKRGAAPHVISRGYGGSSAGPLRVEPDQQSAAEVGDEPLLLAKAAPTWVSRDRVAGGRAAQEAGAGCLLLDDGFQNPSLAKDLSLVVVDAEVGFGNGLLLPAGPLRERVARGLARADAVVLLGEDRRGLSPQIPSGLPLLRARLEPASGAEALRGRKVVAFAGIGRPSKFFASLQQLGCTLVAEHVFPDHHPYTADEVESLIEEAAAADAFAVTTEKDDVRLPTHLRARVEVLPVMLAWNDESALDALLDGALGRD